MAACRRNRRPRYIRRRLMRTAVTANAISASASMLEVASLAKSPTDLDASCRIRLVLAAGIRGYARCWVFCDGQRRPSASCAMDFRPAYGWPTSPAAPFRITRRKRRRVIIGRQPYIAYAAHFTLIDDTLYLGSPLSYRHAFIGDSRRASASLGWPTASPRCRFQLPPTVTSSQARRCAVGCYATI